MSFSLKNSIFWVLFIFPSIVIADSLDGCECGLMNVQNRIFKGSDSTADKYPWIAVLLITGSGFMSLCTGSLIDDRTIVTAAHCVKNGNDFFHPSNISVFFGITSVTDLRHVRARKVEQFFTHPKFHQTHYGPNEFDVALLRLQDQVIFTRNIRPICLPENPDSSLYGKLTVAGYGRVGKNQETKRLQEADINFVNRDVCFSKLSNIFPQMNLTQADMPQSLLCAQGEHGTMICPGDSGAPSMRQNSEGRMVLAGLSQFIVRECGDSMDAPDLHHNLEVSLDFIRQHSTGACYVPSF